MTAIEGWYLDCFRRWVAHYERSPSIRELAVYCDRSHTPVSAALYSLWSKGYLNKTADGTYAEVSS